MYEINVALNGRHLFATHERSLKTAEDATKLLDLFRAKFTKAEGYSISIDYNPGVSIMATGIELSKSSSKSIISNLNK